MTERTDDDRQAAIESMFRVRAIESPANAAGLRTVWHRGLKGAELVSEIDRDGRVVRQQVWLFDECLTWTAGVLRTGTGPRGHEAVAWDSQAEPSRVERFGRALRLYRGKDALVQHLRGILGVSSAPREVTRAPQLAAVSSEDGALAEAARRDVLRRAARRSTTLGLIGLTVGAALALFGLVMLWLSMGS